jgi:hypothetical protein
LKFFPEERDQKKSFIHCVTMQVLRRTGSGRPTEENGSTMTAKSIKAKKVSWQQARQKKGRQENNN